MRYREVALFLMIQLLLVVFGIGLYAGLKAVKQERERQGAVFPQPLGQSLVPRSD